MSTVPVAGHALREKRVPAGRFMGAPPEATPTKDGYWLSWTCECGVGMGSTSQGTSRTQAREWHRKHKSILGATLNEQRTACGFPPLSPDDTGHLILTPPRRRWWQRRKAET